MGTAIRFLKYEISLIEMEMDLDEVRFLTLSLLPYSPYFSTDNELSLLIWIGEITFIGKDW